MKLIFILSIAISSLSYGAVHSIILEEKSDILAETIHTLELKCKKGIIAMARDINEELAGSKLDILSIKGNKVKAVCFGKSY
jgi:hypothetical protein